MSQKMTQIATYDTAGRMTNWCLAASPNWQLTVDNFGILSEWSKTPKSYCRGAIHGSRRYIVPIYSTFRRKRTAPREPWMAPLQSNSRISKTSRQTPIYRFARFCPMRISFPRMTNGSALVWSKLVSVVYAYYTVYCGYSQSRGSFPVLK